MVEVKEFLAFVAEEFKVSVSELSLETTYESIPAWDSMAQLRLVMAIQSRYGVEIPFSEVTNVNSLWEFWRRINALAVKKVIAVDLDGTLWDGVVGEDGLENIRPKIDFLRELKQLKERGILLTILSKNNLEEALAGIASLGVLTIDDFVALRINWQSKAENLSSIAAELNLGIDAFVFVDDNPAERLAMNAAHPEVAIVEEPLCIEAYFPKGEVTAEDRVKTAQYQAEAKRRDYLGDLRIWTEVHPLRDDEIARVAQLSQKANQFNVCTHRYSASDLLAERDRCIWTLHTGDRFGDQGLVAFVIIEKDEVVDFVMSCRVAGRGIEERFWSAIESELVARGCTRILAAWRRTAKNAPVENLFERLGFKVIGESEEEKRYERILG